MYAIGVTVVVLLLLLGLLGAAAGDTLARLVLGAAASDDERARVAALVARESGRRSSDTLAVLGATVLGLAVILFFAANWEDIPRWLRLGALLAGIALAQLAAFREWERRPRAAQTFAFIGVLLFGASIFLVGQMYNVQAHDPLAFLVWSVAATAVGVVARSSPLAGLAVLTLFAWFVFELLRLTSEDYDVETFVPVLFLLLGCALYANATWARRRLDPLGFTGPVRVLGYIAAALGALFLIFPDAHAFEHPKDALDHAFVTVSLWFLAAAAGVGAVLLALGRARSGALWEGIVLLAAPALALLFVYAPETRGGELFLFDGDEKKFFVYPLAFQALLASFALGAIVSGHLNRERWLVSAGALFGAAQVIGSFLDPYWGRLERSLVFAVVGLLVLGLAWVVERKARVRA